MFAQLVLDVSIPDTVTLARQLGLDRLDPDRDYGASLALGAAETSPLEMASAYGTFANRGIRIPPTGILRVLDDDGNVLLDNTTGLGRRVLEEEVADHVTDVLIGVVAEGTGKAAAVEGYTIAGKTGTAQAYRAAWFVGYDPHVTTAVWMGHADKLATLRNINGVGNVTGGSHPARAFSEIMTAALAGVEPVEFPEPAELPQRAVSRDQVVASRSETVANPRSYGRTVVADCGGPCFSSEIPTPALIAPPVTVLTIPPETTTITDDAASPSTSSSPVQGEQP